MTPADKKEIENVLAAKRAELIQTIRGATAKLTLESPEADLIDHIQSMQGRDQVATMVNRFSATLEDVERSLQAISDGSYGICEMCEEPISPKRLKTIPWATYCVRCQEQIEAEGSHITGARPVVRQLAYESHRALAM